MAAECVKVVEESGQTTDECLPVAPDSQRVDLVTPTFSKPTPITNPLHPTSEVKQVIMGGQVDDKPFRTEVTLLPGTRPIPWRGKSVDTAIVQYVAYLDGRIHEVAMDSYAQADDGSVWYFGEDVSNYEDGKVADTEGTWVASDKTPAAMIMPAKPAVGDVYRAENAPGVVFEQVRVEKIDQSVHGPSGEISGAIEVMELHMDGTTEGKVFAPGYGEFSTGTPGGELEAVSLASPTDSRQGPVPAELGALSGTVAGVFDAVTTANRDRAEQASTAFGQAWDGALTKGIPPQMKSQMNRDIDALKSAVGEGDWRAAESAALRVSQNELDLRLLYQPVIDVDLARLGSVGTPASGRCQSRGSRFGVGRCRRTGSGLGTHPPRSAEPCGGGRGDAAAQAGRRRRRPSRGRRRRGRTRSGDRGIARPLTDSIRDLAQVVDDDVAGLRPCGDHRGGAGAVRCLRDPNHRRTAFLADVGVDHVRTARRQADADTVASGRIQRARGGIAYLGAMSSSAMLSGSRNSRMYITPMSLIGSWATPSESRCAAASSSSDLLPSRNARWSRPVRSSSNLSSATGRSATRESPTL